MQKKVYLRLMENYAAYMAHTDHHVGRLIDSLESLGRARQHARHLHRRRQRRERRRRTRRARSARSPACSASSLGLESTINRIDEIGGPTSEPHVPVGWAWAMDAPFQWTKQVASHFGGTRNPMVIHWPKGIKAKGERRTQFHHVIDVVPTILEACKIAEPKVVNGIPQKPIEGVSMLYSFDDANAKGRRTTQYFEMFCNRAIYHDGWVACSPLRHRRGTRPAAAAISRTRRGSSTTSRKTSARRTIWRRANPAKLKELQAKFPGRGEEVRRVAARSAVRRADRPEAPRGRRAADALDVLRQQRLAAGAGRTATLPAGHTITAELTVPKGGAEGVVTCAGSFSAGWSLYVKDGKPNFRYTCFELADVNDPRHGRTARRAR